MPIYLIRGDICSNTVWNFHLVIGTYQIGTDIKEKEITKYAKQNKFFTFLFDRVFQSRYIKERIIENDKNVHLDLAYKNVKTQ